MATDWRSLVCVDALRRVEGAWHDTCGEPECHCPCHTEASELAKGAAAYADEDLVIAEQTSRLSLEDITTEDDE